MKRLALLIVLLALFSPALIAQDRYSLNHGEFGAFLDYKRFSPTSTSTNFYGLGGRFAFNVRPNWQLEAEMGYDFQRNFDNQINIGGTTTVQRSSVRILDGLFGPKIQLGKGAFRPFVTAKGGFMNFSTSPVLGTQFGQIQNGSTNGVFYPGGGISIFAGPIGIRLDVGDEIFWDSAGAHNTLRATIGPQFRF